MDKRNARAERSKTALKAAFLELFQIKEPEEISVVELCERAGVNRSTFYAHYDYMDHLIREVLWESVQELFEGTQEQWSLPLDEEGGVDRSFIRDYLDRFMNHPTIRRFCTCANNGNYLTMLVRAHVDHTLGPSPGPLAYYAAFFHNAGVLNLVLEWLRSDPGLPSEDLVEIVYEFSKVMYRARTAAGTKEASRRT